MFIMEQVNTADSNINSIAESIAFFYFSQKHKEKLRSRKTLYLYRFFSI